MQAFRGGGYRYMYTSFYCMHACVVYLACIHYHSHIEMHALIVLEPVVYIMCVPSAIMLS